ncbi:MAG TPA: glycine cleavage system aminomethyltransferase GcvT [Lacipirellulaceae bacterium]|nr:glycine cleavage system aminomethyltransferase GcvT [Lacipirellulaceae bacterium]
MTSLELNRTPLHDWHVAHGARMVDFAGWAMPVQYRSIVEEHHATRRAMGLFDISHMGRVIVDGPDARAFLDSVLTRRIDDMAPGQVRYSLMCNEAGGVLDDVLVYQMHLPGGELTGYGLVVNAGNRAKIAAWLAQRQREFDVQVDDKTSDYTMIAAQGPRAIEAIDALTDYELTSLRYYHGVMTRVSGFRAFVSRTGYTGEDGCEIICDAADVVRIWTELMERAAAVGGGAVGLAARDTLRLEAGMPLYGHELSEQINPVEAGLEFAVNLRNREFAGRAAIVRFQQEGPRAVRVGLQLEARRPARQGAVILQGDAPVGAVTSGTFSPTFDRPIAMGYVKPTAAAPGTPVAVDIRGQHHAAQVVPLPFYQRGK